VVGEELLLPLLVLAASVPCVYTLSRLTRAAGLQTTPYGRIGGVPAGVITENSSVKINNATFIISPTFSLELWSVA
jgi:hypothetical protein